jgi:hypothetical protein
MHGQRWVAESGEVWIWTREDGSKQSLSSLKSIPLDVEGARGHILRIPAPAIPRGTLEGTPRAR